jgi:hypothetical protein
MDQEHTNNAFPTLGKLENDLPSPEWTAEQLGRYAQYHDKQCGICGRKMAVHRYREGHALTLAFEKELAEKGYGHWGEFLEQHGISTSSDARARKLYAAVENEKKIESLTITEAYERFGVDTPQPQKDAQSKTSPIAKRATKQTPKAVRSRVEKAFAEFASAKGWDEDRKLQVLAELSFPDAWADMLDELAMVGAADHVIGQLREYYGDEPDYLTTLLSKVIDLSDSQPAGLSDQSLIEKAIDRLTKLKAAVVTQQTA